MSILLRRFAVLRALTLAFCAVFSFGLTTPASRAQEDGQPGGQPSKSLSGSSAVATVNGESITLDEWIARMQRLRYQDFVASTNPLRVKAASAGQVALEGLIMTKLVLQYAKKVSLLPTEAEIEAALAEAKKQPGVAQALELKAISEATLRDELWLQRTLFNVATINQSISPDEVARYYAAHPEKYGEPERWRIAILRSGTKEAAEKAGAELKAGKPFADVAKRLSDDASSRDRGGELQPFAMTDAAIPAFIKDAVRTLKPGEVSSLLSSNLGGSKPVYFWVRLIERREKNVVPLEQVRPQVERAALFEKVGGGMQKLAEIRKDAKIEILLPGYKELFAREQQGRTGG